MGALAFLLFKLNTLHKETLSQPKPWGNDSGVLNFSLSPVLIAPGGAWGRIHTPRLLHHDNDVKEVVSSQPSITWYKSANQKIGICTVYES